MRLTISSFARRIPGVNDPLHSGLGQLLVIYEDIFLITEKVPIYKIGGRRGGCNLYVLASCKTKFLYKWNARN